MLTGAWLDNLHLTRGMRCGLNEPTATYQWHFAEPIHDFALLVPSFRTGSEQLGLTPFLPETWLNSLRQGQPHDPEHAIAALALCCVSLAIAMQRRAGDPVGRGLIVRCQTHCAEVAIPWLREAVLRSALDFSAKFMSLWAQPAATDTGLQDRLSEQGRFRAWLAQAERAGLSQNTYRFAMAARERGIPLNITMGMLRLGWGSHAKRISGGFTGETSTLATGIARHKSQTSVMLDAGCVPVPTSALVRDWADAQRAAQRIGFPLVIKPSNQEHGRGVFPGIENLETLRRAFAAADRYSPQAVVVEKHIHGDDHRMLVVGGKLLAAARRIPGGVVGDGRCGVTELVRQANLDSRRGHATGSLLMQLVLDDEALSCLAEQGLTAESVPVSNQRVRLRRIANISAGGTAVDVSHLVHPDNRWVAERAAQLVGLDIAGVDFLCPDIARSWREVGGAVCEVNADPGMRPHWLSDPERDINGEILDQLFNGSSLRIPTTGVVGALAEVANLMRSSLLLDAGKCVGASLGNRVWIGGRWLTDHTPAGLSGADVVLRDPAVDAAMIGMDWEHLLAEGSHCDRYDVLAILHSPADAGGLACLMNLVPRVTRAFVLNASDPQAETILSMNVGVRLILVQDPMVNDVIGDQGQHAYEMLAIRSRDGQDWVVLILDTTRYLLPLATVTDGHHPTQSGSTALNALFLVGIMLAQGHVFS